MSKILWSMFVGFIEGIVIWHCVLYPVMLKKKCVEIMQFMAVTYKIRPSAFMIMPKESYRDWYKRLSELHYELLIMQGL